MIKMRYIERLSRHAEGLVKYEKETFEDGRPAGYERKVITDSYAKRMRKSGSWELLDEERGGNPYKVLQRITEEEYEPLPGFIVGGAKRLKIKGASGEPWFKVKGDGD